MSTVLSHILDALAAAEISHVFTVPGGTVIKILAALRDPRFRIVCCQDEEVATYSAIGWAREQKTPAVALTIGGPGVFKALSALAGAAFEGVPVLLLSGEVSTTFMGLGATQDTSDLSISATHISREITRFSVAADAPGKALTAVRQAIAHMHWQHRPAHIALPVDVASASLSDVRLTGTGLYRVIADSTSHGAWQSSSNRSPANEGGAR